MNRFAFPLSRSTSSANSSTPFWVDFLRLVDQLLTGFRVVLDEFVQTFFGDVVSALSLVLHGSLFLAKIGFPLAEQVSATAVPPGFESGF
jgi:hypothetical protein